MRYVVTYLAWIFVVAVAVGGMLASIAVDAHHWWPAREGRLNEGQMEELSEGRCE
jgi:hypothetical protein